MKQNMKGKRRWLSTTPLPTLFQNYVKENINLMLFFNTLGLCRVSVQSLKTVLENTGVKI